MVFSVVMESVVDPPLIRNSCHPVQWWSPA